MEPLLAGPRVVCSYNPAKRMSVLATDWVSRASASQRRGRAGRVRPGTCLATYTRHRWAGGGWDSLRFPVPHSA